MPSASDISAAIEPGSTEYGDRQVIEDRISQSVNQQQPEATPGAASQATQQRLQQGPVSELPVTDGLSVGPGASPSNLNNPGQGELAEQLRMIAMNAASPVLRQTARDALRALITGSR